MDLFDHEAEREVIGILADSSMLSVEAAQLLLQQSQLSPLDFHLPAHMKVFKAGCALLGRGLPFNLLGVKAELQTPEALQSAGGWDGIARLLMGGAHLESSLGAYVRELKELAVRRVVLERLSKAAQSIREKEVDPNVLLSRLGGEFGQMAKFTGDIQTLTKVLDAVSEHLDRMAAGELMGVVPTGIAVLDKCIGGWQPTLNLVGAEPGVGKSALFATTVDSLAKRGIISGLFTLEDEATWLAWRLLSNETGLDQHIIRFTQMNELQRQRTGQGFRKVHQHSDRVLVVDGSERGMRIEEMVSGANEMVKRGARVILVDHLGEISGSSNEARYDLEVSRHLSLLRGVANRHGVPVVVAAHFKRRDGSDSLVEPKLSDFANSSGAERKARVALGLRRAPGSEVLRIHVMKNTNGKAGFAVEAGFHGAAAMIEAVEGPQEAA